MGISQNAIITSLPTASEGWGEGNVFSLFTGGGGGGTCTKVTVPTPPAKVPTPIQVQMGGGRGTPRYLPPSQGTYPPVQVQMRV